MNLLYTLRFLSYALCSMPYAFFALLPAQLLAPGGESLPQLLNYIMNGGIAVVMFIVWYFTFKYVIKLHTESINSMLKQHEEVIKKYEELVRETKKEYQAIVKESKDDQKQVIERFVSVVEKVMEHNNWIGGLLIRFETQLANILKFIEKK